MSDERFYIVSRERGAEHLAIPTWANVLTNPASLDTSFHNRIERINLERIPGSFQLTGVLSEVECSKLLRLTEGLGYLEDAAVSLPRSVRHNDSVTWVVDDETSEIIWSRCREFVEADLGIYSGKRPLGLNNRFRFYRYRSGDYFSAHTDGSWPGSRVIEKQLIQNAFDDRWSQLTFLLFLSDQFEGGETRFIVAGESVDSQGTVDIKTPLGGALCFPHGTHPLHCVHGSLPVISGLKYIMRSDVLFEI